MSVRPSSAMFCTIMSTLTPASASGPKIAAAMPGRSATEISVILASSREWRCRLTTRDSTISSSSQTSVPGSSEKLDSTCRPHLVAHRELDRARLQHLGAERGEFQHLLVGDPAELARLAA